VTGLYSPFVAETSRVFQMWPRFS